MVRYACLVGGVRSIGRQGQPVSSGTYPAIWTLQEGQKCGRIGRRPRGSDDGIRFKYNTDFFYRRTAALGAEPVGEDLCRVAFPFLGGSQVFEATLAKFKHEHPDKSIDHIYTAPNPLRLKKADALIFYIATKDRVAANPDEALTHE